MKDNKAKKIVVIISVVVVALVLIWFLIVYPLIDFNRKEKELLNAAKNYYERNSVALPNEGEMAKVTMRKLLDQKYLQVLKTTYGSKDCNEDNSWVKVKRANGEYKYYTYLECGNMKSSVDHDGPTIKLNGDEEVEIEKYSTYSDPGVKSVYDDTDGKMDIKVVKIEGTVDTNKIGTYTIKYSATDSFENVNTIERKVKVVQTLDKLVKKETDKSNIYTSETDNYIMFSNMLFRIVGVNDDGSVKIVSDESVGTVNYKDINDWLNDYFYDHIMDDYKDYMVKQDFCTSKINLDKIDTAKNKCDSKESDYVGVLSVSDYNKAPYLIPESISWTSDYVSDKEGIVTSTNLYGTASNFINLSKSYNFIVRPVINLKKGIKLISGDGTISNPYKFVKNNKGKVGDKINTRNTGEYVQYGNDIYRIIEVEDGLTKVISTNNVLSDLSYQNTNSVNIYNPTEKGNIGYLIENNTSKNIKADIFAKKKIQVDIYDKVATYSGNKSTKEYSVKFSAPKIYEMYSGAYENGGSSYWLSTSTKNGKMKYVVSPINVIYYDEVPDNMISGARIVGYLNKNSTILSGDGTKDKPYVLEK